jgi:hypothetical protein
LEHSELVAQNEDLDLLSRVGSGAQHHPTQELGEQEVDQSQRHRWIMPVVGWRRSSRSAAVHSFGHPQAQNEDLDLLGGVGSGAQHHPAEELGEQEVDQSQRHRRIMPVAGWRRSSRSTARI